MNKKLSRAKELLDGGAALAVVNGGGELVFSENGIKTLLTIPTASIAGAFIADKVVGKAAAMILAYAGAVEVYAGIVSEPALEVLKNKRIVCVYGKLVHNIENKTRTDICPMEKTVLGVDDVEEAYELLRIKTGLNR